MEHFIYKPNLSRNSIFRGQFDLSSPCTSHINPLAKIQLFEKLQEENVFLKALISQILRRKQTINQKPSNIYKDIFSDSVKSGHKQIKMYQESYDYSTKLHQESFVVKTEKSSLNFPDDMEKNSPTTTHVKKEDSETESPICFKKVAFPPEEQHENRERKIKIRRIIDFKPIEQKQKQKQKPNNTPKNRSKAKHLWVSYGRKIVEYACKNCEGAFRDRINNYAGKLSSKKEYTQVFLIKSDDSQEDKEFKKHFAKLALEFIENETDESFLSSNYRGDFIEQKDKVYKWIRCLISC